MTNLTSPLLVDEEIVNAIKDSESRRSFLCANGKAILALATVPVTLGLFANRAFGQELPAQVVDVLNFALTLEYLEDEFYRTGLSTSGLIPSQDAEIFNTISRHESDHVSLLLKVLGSQAVAKPTFDFSAGGTFDAFGDYATFQALAQGFEDTGVRAYKGQAGNLMGTIYLTTALQIHSVEARHAAQVRRLRGQKGWVTFNQTDVRALAAVYAGEENVSQGGVGLTNNAAVTEAFDEPLTREQVLAIDSPFIAA